MATLFLNRILNESLIFTVMAELRIGMTIGQLDVSSYIFEKMIEAIKVREGNPYFKLDKHSTFHNGKHNPKNRNPEYASILVDSFIKHIPIESLDISDFLKTHIRDTLEGFGFTLPKKLTPEHAVDFTGQKFLGEIKSLDGKRSYNYPKAQYQLVDCKYQFDLIGTYKDKWYYICSSNDDNNFKLVKNKLEISDESWVVLHSVTGEIRFKNIK